MRQCPLMRTLATAMFLCAAGCGIQGGGPIELRLGHVANPGSMTDDAAQEFARRANEKLAKTSPHQRFWVEPARRRPDLAAEAQARYGRFFRPLNDHVDRRRRLRILRDAVLDRGPRPRGAHPRRALLAADCAAGGGEGLPCARDVGKTGSVRSPTAADRSCDRQILRGSSCAPLAAAGACGCSKAMAPILRRCRSRRCSSPCKPA